MHFNKFLKNVFLKTSTLSSGFPSNSNSACVWIRKTFPKHFVSVSCHFKITYGIFGLIPY